MNSTQHLSILADYREKSSGIPQLLAQQIENVCIVPLKTGDYLINNHLLIERKSASDFIESLISDRLFNQCARLSKSAFRVLLLLEGDPCKTAHQIADNAVKGALLSVINSWQIPVVYTTDMQDSAAQMIMLSHQMLSQARLVRFNGYKPKRIQAHRLRFLQGLPQTGAVRARQLYDYFGSIEAVINAGESELLQVAGIGKNTAKKIRIFLSGAAAQS
ncbi:ERCC4 domain-containing protein [Niabella hirudinis]|uniref:ERCC4 domain-containing protein n=1 Tax=Niabella hirudinis TaxID=1285929 RepID=UPI003EC0ED8D